MTRSARPAPAALRRRGGAGAAPGTTGWPRTNTQERDEQTGRRWHAAGRTEVLAGKAPGLVPPASPGISRLTSKATRSDCCCRSASCSLASKSLTVLLKLPASPSASGSTCRQSGRGEVRPHVCDLARQGSPRHALPRHAGGGGSSVSRSLPPGRAQG